MNINILNTRYTRLGFALEARGQWSFYDKETHGSIGGKYTTKIELLADVERFAISRGYDLP